MLLSPLIDDLKNRADVQKAKILRGFFKTGKGEYGEGDVFLGITVPVQRKIAKQYLHLPLHDLAQLLKSKIHEHRFTALVILASQYKRGTLKEKEKIAKFFLANHRHINNWDLVDTSTPQILGDYLLSRDTSILSRFARSHNVWDRRIAVLATFPFIKNGRYAEVTQIAEMLLTDPHDLIHKAVGWALRELGKKSIAAEEAFLQKYAAHMPRTTLRYAIERFPAKKRKAYLLSL